MEAISWLSWAFDALMGLGLLWLAWQTLACPDLFKAIVLFIAFGLFMALAWVRLEAPDVAMAEAAIGAGLTGALLMAALARLRDPGEPVKPVEESRARLMRWNGWLLALPLLGLLLVLAAGLGYTLLSLPDQAYGLQGVVANHISQSGVVNPVTAVLLNFRGYDTLLEMVVLLLALLGVWSLRGLPSAHAASAPGPVLDTLTGLLVPVLVLVAAYLLWAGAHAPGGAFQAGAILGAAGVLMQLAGWQLPYRFAQRSLRLALVAGVVAFLAVAMHPLFSGQQLLEYPPAHAGILILVIEAIATVSIGVTLAALFLGVAPTDERVR